MAVLGAPSLNVAHCHHLESSMVRLASAPDLRVARLHQELRSEVPARCRASACSNQ